ncbi:MAG: hypothetical protein LBR22_03655 [Desulfovibrio sp.]|jgi:alpha-mannosidase|nr:hypothetical protein [Desulfovibrio sp.]
MSLKQKDLQKKRERKKAKREAKRSSRLDASEKSIYPEIVIVPYDENDMDQEYVDTVLDCLTKFSYDDCATYEREYFKLIRKYSIGPAFDWYIEEIRKTKSLYGHPITDFFSEHQEKLLCSDEEISKEDDDRLFHRVVNYYHDYFLNYVINRIFDLRGKKFFLHDYLFDIGMTNNQKNYYIEFKKLYNVMSGDEQVFFFGGQA